MRKYTYFLAYRKRCGKLSVNWRKPTGGLVQKPARFVEGYPVSDFQKAGRILERRYHCAPHEELIIAEVFEREEIRLARKLHLKWVADVREFRELMGAAQ